MVALEQIIDELNTLLQVDEIPDYPPAHNGLQLANCGQVRKVAAAVDACFPVMEQAVALEADLLVVHHGMFWGGVQPITGSYHKKLKLALDHDLAVYSAHIPLDVHSEYGNNVLLARALGIDHVEPFFPWKGIQLGVRAEGEWSREALVAKVKEAVGGSTVHLCPGGPETIHHLGIITGGAGGEIATAAAEGIDTLVTGEGPHHSYTLAEELDVNLIYAGHYATETFGVKALAKLLSETHGLDQVFIDHPTGL